MTFADLVVVEVVRGRYFDAACTELRIDIVVRDNRDVASNNRQDDLLADQVFVAFVIGVDGDRAVAEHGFRPRCSDSEMSIA